MAVMAVTTALCAHPHALAAPLSAAPAPKPQASRPAGGLVSRLTEGLCRAVAPTRVFSCERRPDRPASQARGPVHPVLAPADARRPLSPFQFRLPPPTA